MGARSDPGVCIYLVVVLYKQARTLVLEVFLEKGVAIQREMLNWPKNRAVRGGHSEYLSDRLSFGSPCITRFYLGF